MLSQEISLSIIPKGITNVINVSEDDTNSRNLIFRMKESVSGTVTIEGKLADGTGFSESCSLSNNVVTVTIKDTMTACGGDAISNLCFKSGNKTLRSENFILRVQRRPR